MNVRCIKVSVEEDCLNFHLIHVGVLEELCVRATPGVFQEILSAAPRGTQSIIELLMPDLQRESIFKWQQPFLKAPVM